MATISPVRSKPAGNGIEQILWTTLTEADTAASIIPSCLASVVGSVQFVGTFGGATIVLQGSNDGTNWWTLKSTSGDDISATAAGGFDFSTAALYVRPSASGGSSQDLDVYMILRSQ